jgi:hypothetical protein
LADLAGVTAGAYGTPAATTFVGIAPKILSVTYNTVAGAADTLTIVCNGPVGTVNAGIISVSSTVPVQTATGAAAAVSGNTVTITLGTDLTALAGASLTVNIAAGAIGDNAATANTNDTQAITITK